MPFPMKPQHELLELLNCGASFSYSAAMKPQHHLVELASAAKRGGGHLSLSGVPMKPQHELLEIARAGSGHVSFIE